MKPANRFYVYVLFRPTGEPCYVGKGQRDRWSSHYRSSHNSHLAAIVARSESPLPRVKVREWLTETQANETEIAFIAAIGREVNGGPLVNQTDGGDGISGYRWSADQKSSLLMLRRSPDYRAKVSAGVSEYFRDENNRKRQAESSNLAYKDNPGLSLKIALVMKTLYENKPELLKARSVSAIAASRTPEHRAKMSAITKKTHDERPDLREKIRARQIELSKDPEHCARRSASAREVAKNPLWRKKISDSKTGQPLTDAQKAAYEARRGVKLPPFSAAHREAIAASKRGIPRSEGCKAAIRAAALSKRMKSEIK